MNFLCQPERALHGLEVGVDARFGAERGGGVATYAAGLREALRAGGARVVGLTDALEAAPTRSRLRRLVHAAREDPRRLTASPPPAPPAWLRADVFREAQAHFALYRRLLRLTVERPPAVMHWAYPLPMRLEGSRNLYTIHDAIPLDRPDLTTISPTRHRRLLDAICAEADGIVTVSETSRRALAPHLKRWRGVITTTSQSLPAWPVAETTPPAGLKPQGYWLFCGDAGPRKNLDRVLAAHARSGVDAPLVIVGPEPGSVAGRDPSAGRVLRLPWVERAALAALMRGARALVFPSLDEGFGLPILEAMSLGAPVLTSDTGGGVEVAGGAALAVDPLDIDAIADAMARLWNDAAMRDALRRRGLARAKVFSVEAHVLRLRHAYLAAGVRL